MVQKNGAGSPVKLEELAAKINASHQACLKSLRASLSHARQTGIYLIEAKEVVLGWGAPWLPWVQEHCKFSVSEAQRYMRIADRYGELLAQCDDPDKLTMTDALKMLSPARKKEGGDARPVKDRRLTVFSEAEIHDRAMDAAKLRFAADSPEEKFVKEKAETLARQVLGLARRSKCKDDEGQAVEPVKVAIALMQQLKKALQLSLVVRAGEPQSRDGQQKAKSGANAHKPANRLNDMAAATAK